MTKFPHLSAAVDALIRRGFRHPIARGRLATDLDEVATAPEGAPEVAVPIRIGVGRGLTYEVGVAYVPAGASPAEAYRAIRDALHRLGDALVDGDEDTEAEALVEDGETGREQAEVSE